MQFSAYASMVFGQLLPIKSITRAGLTAAQPASSGCGTLQTSVESILQMGLGMLLNPTESIAPCALSFESPTSDKADHNIMFMDVVGTELARAGGVFRVGKHAQLSESMSATVP